MEDNGHIIQAETLVEAELDLDVMGMQVGEGRRGINASESNECRFRPSGSKLLRWEQNRQCSKSQPFGRAQKKIRGAASASASHASAGAQRTIARKNWERHTGKIPCTSATARAAVTSGRGGAVRRWSHEKKKQKKL